MSQKKSNFFVAAPVIFAFVFLAGFLLGDFFGTGGAPSGINISSNNSYNKLNEVITYIEQEYVDSVSREQINDKVISYILQELDPHSYYLSAEETKRMNEPLEGGFDGIGVQFSIQKDTVVVITPVSGGPSEKLGIKAGDRIVMVDGDLVAGVGISNSEVMKRLKGERGTKVKVGIRRNRASSLIDFIITRDRIPINSLDVAYMVTDQTAYVKVSRFSRKTYEEFQVASQNMLRRGMTKMILDLRGNGGGVMYTATEMIDEFLEGGKLIVYTKGKAQRREDVIATDVGDLHKIELAILIDEASASASEIVAGAIQDNDRGIIIGRRSFGKGLVQEQEDWPDGSATRLTIARYYTPTGRSIQKPYSEGSEAYHKEHLERFENGELHQADSIPINDSLRFVTPGGKVVYGGGGIVPDVFIPVDTSGGSFYLSEVFYTGQIYEFTFNWADKHRNELERYASALEFQKRFSVGQDILDEFVVMAEKNGVPYVESEFQTSKEVLKRRIKAGIGRNIWGDESFYPILNETDPAVLKALNMLEGNI